MSTLRSSALLALCSLPLAAPAAAQCDRQEWYASDASTVDMFGFSIAAESDTVLVGAPAATGAVFGNSGAAYVFERQPGGGFVETAKLFASDGGLNEEFGWALDLDGSRAVIGAYRIGAPLGTGGVYVFDKRPSGWVESAKLVSSNPGGEIGFAVALDGDRFVVSSRGISTSWVFEFNGTAWNQVAELTGHFGQSLALEGDTLLVGDFENNDLLDLSGAVQVYDRIGGVWTEGQTLYAPAPRTILGHFGDSIALEGERLVVGAPGFERAGVAVGMAFVFERQGGVWTLTATLRPDEASEHGVFGTAVALAGDRILVGASSADGVAPGTGAAFLFERIGGVWTQTARLDAVEGVTGQSLGYAVGFAGDTLLAGSFRDEDLGIRPGSVYAFDLSADVATFCHCDSSAPCGNEDPFGGCLSGSGRGASLIAFGSTSVASDDLIFQATFLPPSVAGLLFMSSGTRPPLLFGNGQLCIGGPGHTSFRFPAHFADSSGCLQEGPGIAAQAGTITAGSTWYFQTWFRDTSGPCGASSNTTNGVAVTFQP